MSANSFVFYPFYICSQHRFVGILSLIVSSMQGLVVGDKAKKGVNKGFDTSRIKPFKVSLIEFNFYERACARERISEIAPRSPVSFFNSAFTFS